MKKQLYLISGMGADERMFRYLQFPPEYEVHYLPWLKPQPNEPFTDYAARMAAGITAEGPLTLLGLSFGGMISLEIARQRPVEKVILISTIKNTRERPAYFNLVRRLGLYRLTNRWLFKQRTFVVKLYMTAKTAEEDALLKDYLHNSDFDFMYWAIRTVIHWENEELHSAVVHIHGSRDHTFPLKYVKPDYTIKGGGHFMIMNQADEINRILSREL